jgi:hypothetical protein
MPASVITAAETPAAAPVIGLGGLGDGDKGSAEQGSEYEELLHGVLLRE